MTWVLDSSAVLALLWREPGSDRVAQAITDSRLSAVNAVEVLTRMIDRGASAALAREALDVLALPTIAFDADQAAEAAALRSATRGRGLSLGDRCCLALARVERSAVLTADRLWAEFDLGVRVELIR